jgi:DNA-directed RNA polymerase specialized sigma24 family protein
MYQDAAQPQVRQLATELYADHHDYLLAIARKNAHTEADAEEALQEAFVSFIAKFDPDGGAPPLAWLTLTLKRQCWRQRREAPPRPPLRPGGRSRGRGARLLP